MMNSEQMHQHALRIAQDAIENVDFLDIAEDDEIAEAMEGSTGKEIEDVWADIHRIITNYTEARIIPSRTIPSRRIRND